MSDATLRTVGLVLLAVVGFSSCGGKGGDVGAGKDSAALSQSSSTAPLPGAAEMATALKVVESGFSVGPGSTPGDPVLTFGAVVENTSELVVQGVTVTIDVRGADGNHIYRRLEDPKEITRLLPGERFGFGHSIYMSTTEISEVRVELSGPEAWDRPENVEAALMGTLSAGGVTTSTGFLGEPVVQFTAASTFAGAVTPYGYAIFRNAAGKIVGGMSQNVGPIAPGKSVPAVIPGAVTLTETLMENEGFMAIPGVDLAKTEVFLSPDLII